MTERGEYLLCGCCRGFFLCPEAEALWAEVNAAYKASLGQANESAPVAEYKAARRKYASHYGEEWQEG